MKKFVCSSLSILLISMFLSQNVLAYQPASHYVLMKETTKNLPENSIIRRSMETYPGIATWGANAPDLPYFQPRQVLEYAPWADRYHYYKIGSLAKEMLQEALLSQDMKKIAFAAGWVTHLTGDYGCHGIYVNPEAGVYLADPSGRPLHKQLESMAEPYLWVSIGGLSQSDYDDGIEDVFSSISDIPFDLLNSACINIFGISEPTMEQQASCAALMTGLKLGVKYKYTDYDESIQFLSENNRKERLENSLAEGVKLATIMLTNAENNTYTSFTNRWNLDVGRSEIPISSLTVLVHTGTEKRGFLDHEWAGTDDDVYFGIRLQDGTTKEWILDKLGYNDFEIDDTDEYYLYNDANIHPDEISSIYLRKTTSNDIVDNGDWFVEDISIVINGYTVLNQQIKKWLDEDNDTFTTDVDFTGLNLETNPDPIY